MKILFVSRVYQGKSEGGIAVTCRNVSFLKEIADEVVELQLRTPTLLTRAKNLLLKEGYAQTREFSQKLSELLQEDFDLVFFDSSLYGVYVAKAKRAGKKTCCFYHNVERKYYRDKFKITGKLQDRLMIPYVDYCEKLSTLNADCIIALNERDSEELMESYGRKADFIFPTSFAPIEKEQLNSYAPIKPRKPYALFVGSNFFANVEGLRFLFKEVAPLVRCDIRVVGSVCKAFEGSSLPDNVILEGVVDDLLPYYAEASCVVSPIFSGSGLKTKTIEALRYGKLFLGTTESFTGIAKEYYDVVGQLCNTGAEFIAAINRSVSANVLVNEKSLELFDACYSNQAQLKRLSTFINKTFAVRHDEFPLKVVIKK